MTARRGAAAGALLTDVIEGLIDGTFCDCDCHAGEDFATLARWQVLTGIDANLSVDLQHLCTDCLLTLLTSEIGVARSVIRMR